MMAFIPQEQSKASHSPRNNKSKMDLSENVRDLLSQFYGAALNGKMSDTDLIHDFEWKFLVLFAAFHMDHGRCVKRLTPQPISNH